MDVISEGIRTRSEWCYDSFKNPKRKYVLCQCTILLFDESYLWERERYSFCFLSIQGKNEPIRNKDRFNEDIIQFSYPLKHEKECNRMPTKLPPNYTIRNVNNAIFFVFVL